MFDIPCLVVFPGVGRDGIDFCDCREVYIYIYIYVFFWIRLAKRRRSAHTYRLGWSTQPQFGETTHRRTRRSGFLRALISLPSTRKVYLICIYVTNLLC